MFPLTRKTDKTLDVWPYGGTTCVTCKTDKNDGRRLD